MNSSNPLTLARVLEVLKTRFGGLLRSGKHFHPLPGESVDPESVVCEGCVRELRAYCLDLPWTDCPDSCTTSKTDTYRPKSDTDSLCQWINDCYYPDDETRTKICLPLVLLSEKDALPDWRIRFVRLLAPKVFAHCLASSVAGHYDRDFLREAIAASRAGSWGDVADLCRNHRSFPALWESSLGYATVGSFADHLVTHRYMADHLKAIVRAMMEAQTGQPFRYEDDPQPAEAAVP